MILGIGLDLVEISRVHDTLTRHDDQFLERILTSNEREFAATRRGRGLAAHVAGRFAAKEAALKALGTGLADGLRWHDVEVVSDGLHQPPRLSLHGKAESIAASLGVTRIHLSITHCDATAAAVVVLEH